MPRLAALCFLLAAAGASAAEPDAGSKPRIAVLYFEASTTNAEYQVFSKGLAELMISDLLATDVMQVVERARLEDVMAELKLGESRFADKSSFAKIGKILGADFLLTGTILMVGKRHFLLPRMFVVETSDMVKLKKVEITDSDLLAAEEAAVADIAQQLLALGSINPPKAVEKRGHTLPLGTAAKYARALDAKDKKDKPAARKLMAEVVAEQPDFKLAKLDLLSLRD